MKLNGLEYSESEILEALKQKGYLILPFKDYTERHIHGSRFEKYWFETKCAVKENETASEKNIWQNVAIKEFQKEFTKPKLS